MVIRHVVTIQVAPGKAASFASAFKPLQAVRSKRRCGLSGADVPVAAPTG